MKKLVSKVKGLTLVEVAIGLAISAVVVATAYAGFESNARRNEVRANANAITEIISGAKKTFGSSPTGYEGVDLTQLIISNVIPKSMHVTDTTAKNSYGGAIDVAGTTDRETLTLSWPNVPSKQCMDLAMALSNSVESLKVGSTTVKANRDDEISLDAATGLTSACSNNAAVDFEFSFKRS
jgi:prepilin-type N-terminal cleavage/methylation domain-containing protein